MKTSLLVLVVALALVAGAGSAWLTRPDPTLAAPDASELDDRFASLVARLDSIERDQSALRHSIDSLALSAHGASAAVAVSAAEVDAAVSRHLEQQVVAIQPVGDAARAEPAVDARLALARLLEPGLGEDERQRLFDEVREAGQLDALVALFEQRVRDHPYDPDVQVDLGEAYLQKIFEVGDGPAAGEWAVKADGAYEAALQLDSRHWDARFSKAVALSFWPPIFGKQAEAIGHFRTLLEQQSGQPVQPKFAQTYLLLGNLYLQSGNLDQAKALFDAGLKLFPNDSELLAKAAQ